MEEIILSALRQFGFSAALCILLLYGCYRLLIWVMTQAANREAVLMAMIKEQTQALNTHTEQAKDFHNEVKTSHEFQRKEHEQLANILNGIQEAVGRINGYKPHS